MRILLTGATGLVGQGVLTECLAADDVARVTVLGRRTTGRAHPKLEELQVDDFTALDPVADRLAPFDACLYCAGAPPVGTPEAQYRHVTHDVTLHVARELAARNPGLAFVYVSGAHADPASRVMPLRIKGETERALRALPLRGVMLRPGGIQPVHGERSPHAPLRALYAVAGPLMGLGVALAPGLMTTTAHVGRAMLAVARDPQAPAVVENREINRLGRGYRSAA